jgi:hypothetical protein
MSGSVSDDTAQSIGVLVGADVLITGSITPICIQIKYSGPKNCNNSKPIEIRGTEPINRNSHNCAQLREYTKFLIGAEFYVAISRANGYHINFDNKGAITSFEPEHGEAVAGIYTRF